MTETALYRHFDAEGRLLYVGVSKNAAARFSQHADKPWFDEIANMTVERFPTRAEAEAAERAAIRAESPIHNIIHSCAQRTANRRGNEHPLAVYLDGHGLNQYEFAKMASVGQPMISRLIRGKATPSIRLAARIQKITEGAVSIYAWHVEPRPAPAPSETAA